MYELFYSDLSYMDIEPIIRPPLWFDFPSDCLVVPSYCLPINVLFNDSILGPYLRMFRDGSYRDYCLGFRDLTYKLFLMSHLPLMNWFCRLPEYQWLSDFNIPFRLFLDVSDFPYSGNIRILIRFACYKDVIEFQEHLRVKDSFNVKY